MSDDLPVIQVDPEKTAWVLVNFITNAIKYAPERSAVEIQVFEKEGWVCFVVTDHGAGIEEKYQPKIFEKYFKIPGSPDQTGTGLGLAICKEFIESQGGTIWVQSQMGQGSSFGFSFRKGQQKEIL